LPDDPIEVQAGNVLEAVQILESEREEVQRGSEEIGRGYASRNYGLRESVERATDKTSDQDIA
jgi:hypothetical protein